MVESGVPDLRSGLGKRIGRDRQFFLTTLSSFEKIGQIVHVGCPDTQGPFNLTASIIGSDVFLAVYDTPEIVHRLLQLVTETCIAFIKFHKKNVNEPIG